MLTNPVDDASEEKNAASIADSDAVNREQGTLSASGAVVGRRPADEKAAYWRSVAVAVPVN